MPVDYSALVTGFQGGRKHRNTMRKERQNEVLRNQYLEMGQMDLDATKGMMADWRKEHPEFAEGTEGTPFASPIDMDNDNPFTWAMGKLKGLGKKKKAIPTATPLGGAPTTALPVAPAAGYMTDNPLDPNYQEVLAPATSPLVEEETGLMGYDDGGQVRRGYADAGTVYLDDVEPEVTRQEAIRQRLEELRQQRTPQNTAPAPRAGQVIELDDVEANRLREREVANRVRELERQRAAAAAAKPQTLSPAGQSALNQQLGGRPAPAAPAPAAPQTLSRTGQSTLNQRLGGRPAPGGTQTNPEQRRKILEEAARNRARNPTAGARPPPVETPPISPTAARTGLRGLGSAVGRVAGPAAALGIPLFTMKKGADLDPENPEDMDPEGGLWDRAKYYGRHALSYADEFGGLGKALYRDLPRKLAGVPTPAEAEAANDPNKYGTEAFAKKYDINTSPEQRYRIKQRQAERAAAGTEQPAPDTEPDTEQAPQSSEDISPAEMESQGIGEDKFADMDAQDVPNVQTSDWHDYRRLILRDAMRRGTSPETVDKQMGEMQARNFANFARQGLFNMEAGNDKGAAANFRAAYQFVPNGMDVEFSTHRDPQTGQIQIVGYGKDEKTNQRIPGTEQVLDPGRVAAMIEEAQKPGAFNQWMKDKETAQLNLKKYEETERPLAQAQIQHYERADETAALAMEGEIRKALAAAGLKPADRLAYQRMANEAPRLAELLLNDTKTGTMVAAAVAEVGMRRPNLNVSDTVDEAMNALENNTFDQWRTTALGGTAIPAAPAEAEPTPTLTGPGTSARVSRRSALPPDGGGGGRVGAGVAAPSAPTAFPRAAIPAPKRKAAPPQRGGPLKTVDDVPQKYRGLVQQVAQDSGYDPNLVARLFWKESRYREDVISGKNRSKVGAYGIGQIYPKAWPKFQRGRGVEHDARESMKIFDHYAKMFKGDLAKAAAAYNAGEGPVMAAVKQRGARWLEGMKPDVRDYVTYVARSGARERPIS